MSATNESILTRVKDAYIGTANSANNYFVWTGIRTVSFGDVDQWVHLNVPYGKMLYQEIKSPHIEGELHCYDLNALRTALYTTIIDAYNHYAIDATDILTLGTIKWKVTYFVFHFVDHTGTVITATLTDFRVKIVEIVKVEAGKEAEIIVKFSADEAVFS